MLALPLIDVDAWGAVETWSYDHTTGAVQIKRETNIAPVLEVNHAIQGDGFDRKADMWPIASIPLEVLSGWLAEYHRENGTAEPKDPFDDKHEGWNRFVYRRLDDSSYRKLRTGLFRIGHK